MPVEARVRLRHHGCYSERLPPGTRVVHVSGDDASCLCHVHAPRSVRRAVLADISAWIDAPLRVLTETDAGITVRCPCPSRGLAARLAEHGARVLWPTVHERGLERWRLLADTRRDMERALDFLRTEADVEVEEMGAARLELLADPVGGFVGDLTPRQLAALRLALARGYFAHPRRTTVAALAREAGVAPSTFQEHLRKAHHRVLGAVGDLLAAHEAPAAVARGRVGRPRRR